MKKPSITGEPAKDVLAISANADPDPDAPNRKQDHIALAFESQQDQNLLDKRFYYEPLLSKHPGQTDIPKTPFLGKTLKVPVWVSSMTGGTAWANTINANLARACKDFGMGMGLGSCRALLYSDEHLSDFDVRPLIGDDLPLYANLGVAQVEQLIIENKLEVITEMVHRLRADGLIIHVNPMQEWLQPEGDRFQYAPIEVIETMLDKTNLKVIVKEVGQGMGVESLKTLMQLPLQAIDFAANGGTNFAKLELLRSTPQKQALFRQIAPLGHSASEMVDFTNGLLDELGDKVRCHDIIISGGVKDFLDGYYLIHKIQTNAIYGQASSFLKHARGTYEELHSFIEGQLDGLALAYAYLKCRV